MPSRIELTSAELPLGLPMTCARDVRCTGEPERAIGVWWLIRRRNVVLVGAGAEASSRAHRVEFEVSASDEPVETGQRWRRTDGSGDELVINGRVENDAGTDWDVTLIPSYARVMRTTDFIIDGYRLV
jgi:hypothetical protein